MTKKDIVRQIASEMGVDQTLTREIVQRCLDSIIEALMEEGRIELRNFGIFEVKQRAPRKARNPQTNEEIFVPAKQSLTFKPGKNVSQRLQDAPAVTS
ncbi:MAG: HU family DNA-binding protein [Phycisphaerae bacterium]